MSGVDMDDGNDCAGICGETDGTGDGDNDDPPVLGRGSIDIRLERLPGRLDAVADAAIEPVSSAADTEDARVRAGV